MGVDRDAGDPLAGADVAKAVVAHLSLPAVRRQLDVYGQGLTTTADAAATYNEALGRLLRLQGGAEELVSQQSRKTLTSQWGMQHWPCSDTSGAQALTLQRRLPMRRLPQSVACSTTATESCTAPPE
ncbi:hypothetical protein F1D05_30495 [Kribbella qitaiheensis]|uniref:Uncharacterized protein n=1 Tax=Kribbella qitaiheensis TaxID=1544730 RepID=A0A7G6X5E3_9ACTN|nr:hypothetical protein [Kribbella qitaiheensis]QNE21458.1 hypothetical protein F1D05_30495 [Kribbella qitaiheensis]